MSFQPPHKRPLSFTKNLGKGRHIFHKVVREHFYQGIPLTEFHSYLDEEEGSSIVPIQFLVCTKIEGNQEVVSKDALIDEALRRTEYDPILARLYLFSILCNLGGQRKKDIYKHPSGAHNIFVREYLYSEEGWIVERLNADYMEDIFQDVLDAERQRKFSTNFAYFFEECEFSKKGKYINTYADHWGTTALKLFFQRYEIMYGEKGESELIKGAKEHEVHKLLGVPYEWLHEIIQGAVTSYKNNNEENFIPSQETEKENEAPKGVARPERRTQQILALQRAQENRTQLKKWYEGRCQICGNILTSSSGYTFDGGHIVPLGSPHDGPDSLDNMLSLCPNHHRQLDVGAIAIKPRNHNIETKGDSFPTPSDQLHIHPKHELDDFYFKYHYSEIFNPDN